MKITIGIDPGSEVSGLALFHGKKIIEGRNVPNKDVVGVVLEWRRIISMRAEPCTVVIEDIVAYGGRVRTQTLQTCKWMGELCYRLGLQPDVKQVLVARSTVKAWIFDACPDIVLPRLVKVMEATHKRSLKVGKKGLKRADGTMRKPSFQFITDNIIEVALKSLLNIPVPKPGKPQIYGLKTHSWQACGVAAHFLFALKKKKYKPITP